MKKILFIDRDGTLIREPADTFQIDSLEKLEFIPGCITALNKIALETDYLFVMVSNQDGLGTDSFPEETFRPAQQKLITTLAGEGVCFDSIIIDKTFEYENKPTRKPGTALLQQYLDGMYDLANSYVIGDRLSDLQLAANLGAKAIILRNELHTFDIPDALQQNLALHAKTWQEIYSMIRFPARRAVVERKTNETNIVIKIDLDGEGKANICTGLSFFDHMLEQLARHSGMNLYIRTQGDLQVDEHHTIEDTAIALGDCLLKALGDKKNIERYAFVLPMDDCLAQVAIDLGGRSWLIWDAVFRREKIGNMPTEMFYHFFKSFSDAVKCNLNIRAEGNNEHHKIESIFKALARCLKQAIKRELNNNGLPTTKGVL
ncbi:MAG: bifunctional histidinol-phosphatase/imidazoleglycerol-phosphate dehydratase HisB [Bacteroidetes bacterium]|nr:bifunctional histidinol-phosphatase/imidazoleglycerol-phosphate dehydratase HisB [Bacteroidota bacterium]